MLLYVCMCAAAVCHSTDPTGYAWEGTLERSWDAIEEDETGKLKINMAVAKQQRQRCAPVYPIATLCLYT